MITTRDIVNSITLALKPMECEIFLSNTNVSDGECMVVNVYRTNKTFINRDRQLNEYFFDIIHFPDTNILFDKISAMDIANKIDSCFAHETDKGLKVKDRFFRLQDIRIDFTPPVNNASTGLETHYKFKISFYDNYGQPYQYELMQELEVKYKNEVIK